MEDAFLENFLNGYEIKLEKDKDVFIASCALFPNLKATGETEEIALENLATEISESLTKAIHKVIKKMLSSENYTEIIFDHTEEKPTQSRYYSLDTLPAASKSIVLKLDSVEKDDKKSNQSKLLNIINKDPSLLKGFMSSNVAQDDSGSIQTLQRLLQNEDEGFSFGFPVSFN